MSLRQKKKKNYKVKVVINQPSKKRIFFTYSHWGGAKISFNIILLNLAVRIIAIFLLIDLFVFSS